MKSVKFIIRFLILTLCVSLLGNTSAPAAAQQMGGQYFLQSGHNILGEFWTFYQGVADAGTVFGLPITEQFVTADGSGLTVQYFEKARLEFHPDLPLGQRIQVTGLGQKLYHAGAPSVNLTTSGACRELNGFGVCYDFLAFFDQHGGQARFGNPLSAFEFLPDGRIVQYFERARFEWYPELAAGQNVRLTDVGWLYFANQHEDSIWLNPARAWNFDEMTPPPLPVSLRTMVFVAKAVTLSSDTQKVFVVVQDQALNPVYGTVITVTLRLPDGEVQTYPLTTDANGIGLVSSISFTDQSTGSLATVDVQVSYRGLLATATTSFRIWR